MLRPLALTISQTDATKKATGSLKSKLSSILPEQKPESVTRRVMRAAETEKLPKLGYVPAPGGDIVSRLKRGDEQLKRAQEVESAKRGTAVAPSIQEQLTRKAEMVTQESTQIRLGEVARWAEKNPLKFDSIFGEVSVVMAPEIAERYRSGDPGTKLEIMKMYHDQAVEEAKKSGRKVSPRWKNSEAAKTYELGKILTDTEAGRMAAQQGELPRGFDRRFDYQPYKPGPQDPVSQALRDIGNVGDVLGDQLNAYFQNVPGGYAQFRRDNPDLFQGASNVMRGAAERTYEALPTNPMLNLPGQFWESAADLLDPSASLGKTTMGAVGVGGALFPYAKGIGAASTMLKAGSKFGPALEAGLNAAAREGIIGWSMLERNVRARDLANILEGTGAFASKAEKADFIKQIQKDAKEWASKNSKDANEFLEQQDEFYKNLIRPTLNDLVPQGVSPGVTRAANAAIGGPQFQPAVGQTLAPVTNTRRVSALAGELAIPEGERYQQLIPDLKTDDEIEQAVMDVYTKLVSGGLPTNQATEVVANLARNLKQQVSQTPEKITVYHGTTGEFEGIPSAGMSRTGAIHVTPDKKFAENFTNIDQPNAVGQTPSIKEFQLDTTKIADLSQPALKQSFIEFVVNKYGLKRDPFDPEFTTINTRTFDPEGYNYPNGMTIEDLADDIDSGKYWIAESEAAKEWAKANGYAGVRAVEDGTETFAIFDNSALGAKKATSASSTFIDNLDTKIAQLEQETKGRMYSGIGIDPSLVQLYALKAFREVYRGGVQAFRAVKAVMGKDADDVEFYKAVSERLKEFLNRNKTELISRKAVTLSLQPGNEKTDIVDLVEAAVQEAGIDVTKDAKKAIVEMASKMYVENAYTRPFKKVGPDRYKVSAEDLKQQAFRAEDGKIYARLHPGYDTLNGGVYTTLGGRQIMLLGGSDYPLFDEMYGTVATSNKGKGSATALLKETKNTPLVLISLLKNDNLLNSPLGSSLFFEDMADLIAGSVKGADGKPIKITEQEIVTTLQKLFEGIGKDKWLKRRGPDGKLIDVDAKTITTLEDWKRLVQQTFDNGATFKEQLLKRDKRIKKAKEPGARVEVFTRPAEEIIDMASNPEQRFSQPGTVVSAIAVDPIVGSAEYFGVPDHVSFPHVQAGLGLGDTNHVSLIDLFPEEWQKYKGMAEGRYQKYLDATDAEKKAFDDAIKAAKSDKGTTVPEADIVEDELEKGILIGDRPDAKTVKENKLSVEQVKEAWGMQNSLPQPAHFITKVQKGNDKFELTERGIDLLTGRGNIRQDILPADVNAQGTINDQPGVGGKIRTSELMGGGRSRKEIGRTPEQIAELEQKNLSRTAQLEEQVVQSEARQAVGKEVRAAEKKLSELAEKPLKNIEKNQAKIAELKEIIKSQKRSLGKNRQRGAYIPPTKEEIELLARTALDTVYRTGEKVVDTVKNMVRYLDLREEDVNKIYDSIRGLDQEVGKEIPTVQVKNKLTGTPEIPANKAVWHHGTTKQFDNIDFGELKNDLGFFLTSDKSLAEQYTKLTPFSNESSVGQVKSYSANPKKIYDIRFGTHDNDSINEVLNALISRADKGVDTAPNGAKAMSARKLLESAKKALLNAKNIDEWESAEAKMYDAIQILAAAESPNSFAKNAPLREELLKLGYDSIRKSDDGSDTLVVLNKSVLSPTTQTKATVPPTDLPDLVATANRITEEVRKSVGLDGATKATPEQIADWTEEARKINTSKLMNDMMSGTGNLRPLSKAEELAVGARLSRALERYSSALDELRTTDTPSSELLDRIDSARDEIDEISKFSLAVGTEWGKAGIARQALIRADYTTAGVITRIRKQEKLLSKDSSMAIQATKQEMADAEEFARISREKDDKIAALEKKIEDLKAQGAKEAPKRRLELRRQKLESERDDILSQIMGIRSGEKKVPQPKMTGESGAINIADDVALFELYGKLAKNTIQRGALSLEDVYYYVSEVAKRAGHTITKQGMIDALDAQMLKNRRVGAKRATKAELRARQRLYREVERGATRNVAEREREIAAKEAARKAREEAIQIKKDEIAAKREAIRAEREAQKATSKAEADAYRAAAKQAREEARALAKQLREAERKAKLDARQARRAELNEALGPIARDERKIANLKGRIEDYNRMIETGEFFASRALKEGDEGYELTHLQTQLEQLRYEAKVAKQNVDTIIDDLGQPTWKKVLKEVIELPRYMQLGLDAGALTRQGFDIALVSPTAWTKAAKQGFGAAISNPAKVARLEEEFMRDPEVLKAIANGLAIDGPSAMPEGFVSKAAQKIPLYGRGERFHKTFQNFARYETYRNLTRGQNMNQYQLKETANLINAMTGRGKWKGAQGPLASIYTAPKMYAGQLEVMAKTATALVDRRFRTNPAYRKLIVRRWLGRMAGIVALKTLADATDWEFSINPDDSDFLKLRNGNTVIDVTGGYSSWYKLLFSTLNDIVELGMSEPFVERLQRSLGYKISPTYRLPLSLITGKDAIGKPFFRNPDTDEREVNVEDLAKTFAPLIGMQIYEMAGGDEGYADMDNPAKVALGGLSFIGTGVSNYEAKEPSRKPEDTKWGQFLDSIGVQPR